MPKMFIVKNSDGRQNSFVATSAEHALQLALEAVTVWKRKNLIVTETSWPSEWLDACESNNLYGLYTTQRRNIYIGGTLLSKSMLQPH